MIPAGGPVAAWPLWAALTGSGDAATAGAVMVVAVRATAALAEARVRAGDWPVWRSGPAVPAVVGHDVVAGLLGFGLLAVLPSGLAPGGLSEAVLVLGTVVSLLASGLVLRRGRGIRLTVAGGPGALGREPTSTVRQRLLTAVERRAARASASWIAERLEHGRREACVPDDQLLSAVWSAGRVRLRECVGVGRTEVALLLLQAQAVADDASPPQERLLTLLHLVHVRCGRRGVRAVLDQAVRGPLRHGRPGPATGFDGVPGPLQSGPPSPFPKPTATSPS